MEKTVYKKDSSPIKTGKKAKRYLAPSLVLFLVIEFAVFSFVAYSASQWFAAMWTLMSFDNLFVTATLVACGLLVVSILFMFVGLMLMLAGKNAGRFLGLVALIASGLGSAFLCGVVVFNALRTNTALVSMMKLYFIPIGLALLNAVAGTIYLLFSEGLKEHLASRRKPKFEPPRPRLPETPAKAPDSAAETAVEAEDAVVADDIDDTAETVDDDEVVELADDDAGDEVVPADEPEEAEDTADALV